MEIMAVIASISAPMDCFYIPGKNQRIQVGFRQFDSNEPWLFLDFYDDDMKILEEFNVNDAVKCSFGINFYNSGIGITPFLTGYNLYHVVH